MKLSDRLRSHQWRCHPSTPNGQGWENDDTPLHAGDCLEKCEMLFEDVLCSFAKIQRRDDANLIESVASRIRIMLSELRAETIPVAAFYVLEDGKHRPLPSNVEEAIDLLREEFIAGHSHGVLKLKEPAGIDVGGALHASGEKDWAVFEIEARAWLARANAFALHKEIQKNR
jgi:hypothetical protein